MVLLVVSDPAKNISCTVNPIPKPPPLTTPNRCRLPYLDLKRRFSPHPSPDAALPDDATAAAPSSSDDKVVHIPWLEELRKLRVAELQQEVQRYDVSILSLQLKVKKLEEEREESLREKHQKPNLAEDSKGNRSVKDKRDAGEELDHREALAREGSSGQGREALARARGRRRHSELGQKQGREVKGQEHPGRRTACRSGVLGELRRGVGGRDGSAGGLGCATGGQALESATAPLRDRRSE
ncbi:hypothetical protein NL676_029797 [Syzygium grande]|nr:hypothetical protein NL676_029797 [Syzygium grande]